MKIFKFLLIILILTWVFYLVRTIAFYLSTPYDFQDDFEMNVGNDTIDTDSESALFSIIN